MQDSHSRKIDYMRVSITDRCNLRCGYCVPEGFKQVSHDDILRYEEILRLCKIIASTGVNAIRVTGGEPLVRKGFVGFVAKLKATQGIKQVTLTTNGILLKQYIASLSVAKLDGLNISLDTLDTNTYKQITGKDRLRDVLDSIEKAINIGINMKINSVLMRGVNEKDILPMAKMAETLPIDIRFIELMPTDCGRNLKGVDGAEVLKTLKEAYPDLEPDFSNRGQGPAKYYKSSQLVGRIGFINAMSDHICKNCNRIRLTSQGFLKLCLFSEAGVDLREMLHRGASDDEIKVAVNAATFIKLGQPAFDKENGAIECMSNIGG